MRERLPWFVAAGLGVVVVVLALLLGGAGAIGVMQLLPSTAADKAVGIPDITTAENNIHAGVKYLRFIVDHYFDDPDLDELEDHLREEIGVLEAAGLSTEEAYLVACRRLGKPEDLSGEFAIADPERRRSFRLSWMIIGALALGQRAEIGGGLPA